MRFYSKSFMIVLGFSIFFIQSASATWGTGDLNANDLDCNDTDTLLLEKAYLHHLSQELNRKLPGEKSRFKEIKAEMAKQYAELAKLIAPIHLSVDAAFQSVKDWKPGIFESPSDLKKRKEIAVEKELRKSFELYNGEKAELRTDDNRIVLKDIGQDKNQPGGLYESSRLCYDKLMKGIPADNVLVYPAECSEVILGNRIAGADDLNKRVAEYNIVARKIFDQLKKINIIESNLNYIKDRSPKIEACLVENSKETAKEKPAHN